MTPAQAAFYTSFPTNIQQHVLPEEGLLLGAGLPLGSWREEQMVDWLDRWCGKPSLPCL